MPDPVANSIASQISTPPPSLSQQASGYTDPNSPAPASATAPVNMPQGPAPNVPAQQQPAVKGPSPWQRAVHALLGSQTEYQQTPNGPIPTQVQNKIGQLFRSILAGAILGAGAGTANAEHSAGSGWNAAGQGAAAAAKGQQEQQQQRAAQAQQQFKNMQSAQQENREQANADREAQMTQAQIANFQAETAARQHTMDLQDKEYMDKHNEANRALYNSLQAAGGTPPPEGELPGTISAYDLAQKYSKNPKIRQPSNQNMTRHFIDTTTAEEVTWDPVKNIWVEENGTPADMTAKTEFKVLDVPVDSMTKKRPTSGKDVNAANGSRLFPDDASVMLSPLDMIALRNNHMKGSREDRSADIADRQNKVAEYNAAEGKVTRDNDALKAQIKELEDNPAGDLDGKQRAQLNSRMDANNDWLDQQYESIWGKTKTGGTPKTPPPSGTVPPPSGPDSPSKLLIGKMQQDDKIQPGTPEAYEYITNSGLKPADQQAALRDSKTPIPWIQATRAADQLIAKTPMSREAALRKVIQQAQARGVAVADRPTGGNVFSPYPNLSSSNITASDAQ